MPLQTSGAISLANIQTEFGGSNPIGINEYYRGGGLVPNTTTNLAIPTSGQISFSNFYGASVVQITLNNNYSVEDYQDLGSGAVASITFESDGDIILSPGGDVGDWISPKSAAPGSYQIRATLVSGDTPTGTTLNTWHNLTSNRTWSVAKLGNTSGTISCTLTIEIRLGTTVLDSATVTLYAEVLDGGGGGNQ